MQIWPAIDIRNGKCVRLAQGDYSQETVYGSDPADMAHRWVMDGATALHIVDLDGARTGKSVNKKEIERIAQNLNVECQVGGGIRDESTIAEMLEIGVARLVIGTKAITDPDWLGEMSEKYSGRLLVGIDARGGKVATDGWKKTSDVTAVEFVDRISGYPLAGIIFTDIARDGMLGGPNLEAKTELVAAAKIPVIASGGITTAEDIRQLAAIGLQGCVIGKSLYEGRMTLAEAIKAARDPVSPAT